MNKRSIAFLTLINTLNYLDRYLVPAVLPVLISTFSLSHEQGGRIVSAFVIGYTLFSPIFGYLGDRTSRPFLMFIGVFLWSIATMSTAYAAAFTGFILARISVGIGEASYGTIAPGYIKDHIDDPIRLNRVLSFFYAAIPVGAALGFVTGGYIAQHYSWREAFLVGGAPGLVLSLFLLRFKEIRRAPPDKRAPLADLDLVKSIPMLRFAIGGYIFNSFALNGIAAFVSNYGVHIGFELEKITTYFGLILVITGLIGTVGGGAIASRLAARSKTPTLSMMKFVGIVSLLAVPALVGAFLSQNHTNFLLLCAVAELLIFAGVAPINSIIVLECPPELVTFSQGVTIFMINVFGAALGPLFIGIASDQFNLPIAMQLSSAAALISGAIWLSGGIWCHSRRHP